ncbi:MAG: hypothetical protein ACI9OU_000974 [Candidatus Promineifilaceae bacterium]|jgi:hypothetical protein
MKEHIPQNADPTANEKALAPEEFALPDALQKQLTDFEKRLCRTETMVAVFGGITALLLAFGLVFLSDRFWDTSPWLRAGIALGSTLALFGFFWIWFRAWVLKRRDSRELARLVQRKYRRMGDRLLGAVELARPDLDGTDQMSPSLRRAAIQQVGAEAAQYSFKDAVDTRTSRRFKFAIAGLGILVAAAAVLYPEAGMNALQRWLRPLSEVPRYTFVTATGFPASIIVAHGEPFEITGRIEAESKWVPNEALSAFDGQPPIHGDLTDKNDGATGVHFDVPGQTDAGALRITLGDYKDQVDVVPLLRPELQDLQAIIQFPAYLQQPAKTNRLQTPHVQIVEGSKLALQARISRELTHAHATATNPVAVRAVGQRIVTESFTVDTSQRIRFNWTDEHGLKNERPYSVNIKTIQDEAPFVECRSASRSIAILEDEVIHIDLSADDDFGVQTMWVEWTTMDTQSKPMTNAAGSHSIADGHPTQRRLTGSFDFSPLIAHVPEESIATLTAYASDYHPDHPPSQSPALRIYVLSRAQHADLVLKQMEAVHAQLEDITRLEEELLDDNKAISEMPPEEMASPETRQKLRENEATEHRQSDRLDRLTEETRKLMKEALRNSDIPESTLAEWSELQKTMEDVSEQNMDAAAKDLQKAGDTPSERKEQTEKAIAKEEDAVKKLQKAGSEMNDSLEDMMAESFVNRLRQASEREKEVATGLGDILPKTIGLDPDDLPADVKEEFGLITSRQQDTHRQVGYIQDDLAGFFSRTRTEKYNAVYKEMRNIGVVDALDRLTKSIQRNLAVQSISDATKWSKQLAAWAESLSEKKKQGGEGGGEGGGPEELDAEDMETLISLMRARKQEESLRQQTRLLNEGREKNRRYRYDARKLARKQDEIAAKTRPLERRVKNPKLRQLIEKLGGEMMNASMLLQRPQTDTETVAIETEIIELLSNSIDSASGSQSSAAAKKMMAQMGEGEPKPGPGGGSKPGPGGGSGGGRSEGEGGPQTTVDNAGRNVERSTGLTHETPQEFKDVLEAYFRALEDSQ